MKFCWVTINVQDLEKSIAFYTEVAGLKVARRMNPMPDNEIVFLTSDGTATEVELIRNARNTSVSFGKDISIGFEVSSLDEFMAFLADRNIPIAAGPFQPNPMVRFLYLLDPNGLRVQFVENKRN